MRSLAGRCNAWRGPWREPARRAGSTWLLAFASACAWATEVAADPARQVAYGRHLAQECTTCHRLDGIDNGIPSIVGWDPARFRETLQFYQDGRRTNPVMVSVAQSLDDEQMQALAAYYTSLPKPQRSADRAKSR